MKLPCRDCITLGVCKGKYVYKSTVTTNKIFFNAQKARYCCSLFNKYYSTWTSYTEKFKKMDIILGFFKADYISWR